MIEIPIWILFTLTIAALGLGVTIGFKVAEKKPELLESESFCKVAHFSQPKWPTIIFKMEKELIQTVLYLLLKVKSVSRQMISANFFQI